MANSGHDGGNRTALHGLIGVVVTAVGAVVVAMIAQSGGGGPQDPGPSSGSTPVAASPPPPSPSPATAPPSPGPARLSAQGVVCEPPRAGGAVDIVAVRAEDGGTTLNDVMVVDVSVHQPPPADGHHWLMALVPSQPRPIHVARDPLAAGAATIRVQVGSPAGSTRTFYIASSTATSDPWFVENRARDGDSTWDGNRLRLPDGATEVSNRCTAERLR